MKQNHKTFLLQLLDAVSLIASKTKKFVRIADILASNKMTSEDVAQLQKNIFKKITNEEK